ncbi:MAG: AsmA family protein [Devosia sp.]
MLNRLFVIIGFLVILAIGGAFLIPRFIQWGDYRARLEAMSAQAFGTEVAITGDIQLTLLPQPQIVFTKVRVGPEAAPAMEVDKIEAEFSLLDFLSDRYKVTRLRLDHPVINVGIGTDGALESGLVFDAKAEQSNVSIDNADVRDGSIRLADARSGKVYAVDAIEGALKLEALKGPFSFQGTATLDGAGYGVRVGTGKLDEAGATNLSLYVKASDDSFSLDSQGALEAGAKPKYTATITYRRPPPKPLEGETLDAGRGDLVLEGKIEAGSERVLLTDYTLVPDENRGATRLTGAAELKVGKDTSFNAILSGGVMALPPRDATKELTDPPYELVRLLGETPLPPIPGIPGTVGIDVTELNLRGVSLRNLRLDAKTDAHSWTITDFAATLPGGTSVGLTGNLSVVDGHPIFAGGVTLASQQLDRLASLWRKPTDSNPLFGMAGSLTSDIALSSDTLTLSSGTLIVGGINQGFDASIGFSTTRELKLDAHFTTLGEEESAAIAALMPDMTGSSSFGATFPKGTIDLSASKAVLFGLLGDNLAVSASWEGGVLELSKLSTTDLGGAAIDAKLTAFGTLMKPELSGSGSVKVSDNAPIVGALLGNLATPPAVAEFLRRSLPATLAFQLAAPSGDGSQALSLSGKLGTADAKLEAQLGAGIANALTAPILATLDLASKSPALMSAQLGLGDAAIFDDRTPLRLSASVDGVPSNSYELHARLEGGADHIEFAGNVVPGDFSKITGGGTLDVALADPAVLAETLGAGGIYLPPLAGTAKLQFAGLDSLKLSEIAASGVTGDLALIRHDSIVSITGAVSIAALDVRDLLPVLVGASGTVAGEGLWPEGPIDIGQGLRSSEGRVDVSVATLNVSARPVLTRASFGMVWDAQSVSVSDLTGDAGSGRLSFDVKVCCANPALPDKQVSGRLALNGVPLDLVVPDAIGAGLDGTLDGAAQFDGTGASLAAAMSAMTGSGSYTISDFSAAHFDPQTFNGVGTITGLVDMAPEEIAKIIAARLDAGPFKSNLFTGGFTIAGGTLRSPNLAIAGDGARIFGGANVGLGTLGLDARYSMSPTVIADPLSLVDPTTSEIAAAVTGSLWAPVATYDVSSLAEGMKIKASEIELARLEQLRVEDEARQKAAADDRVRVAAEQAAAEAARQAEVEAAAKALADEAAAKAADDAAKKAAADAAKKAAADAAKKAAQPAQPLDLGL